MYAFVIVIHMLVCALLITVILIQSGRGGGLVDSFSAAESIFGTKTNTFLVRTTTVLAVLFLITSLSLTFISVKQGKSLMQNISTIKTPPVTEKKNITDTKVSQVTEKKDVSNQKGAPAPEKK